MYQLEDTITKVRAQPPVYRVETRGGAVLDVVHDAMEGVPREGDTLRAEICGGSPAPSTEGWLYAAQGASVSAAPAVVSCGGLLFQVPPGHTLGGGAQDNETLVVRAAWRAAGNLICG